MSDFQRFIQEVNATPHGDQYRARAECHGGDSPTTLAIAEGADGEILIYCHKCEKAAFDFYSAKFPGINFFGRKKKAGAVTPADCPVDAFKKSMARGDLAKPSRKPKTTTAATAADLASKKNAHGFWEYRDAAGEITGVVLRHNKPDGDKDMIPWRFTAPDQWTCAGFDKPHPLYGLHLLSKKLEATVALVEGEKTANAANGLLPAGFVAVSPHGGCKRFKSNDYSPLAGRRIITIADNDDAGRDAMARLAPVLLKLECDVLTVTPPPEFPRGWDLADEFPDGWGIERLLALAVPFEQPAGLVTLHDVNSEPFSDAWNATELAARGNGRLLWHYEHNRWYSYDGKRWNPHSEETVQALAKENARAIRGHYFDTADKSQKSTLRKLENREKLNNAIVLSRDLLPAHVGDFDCDPWLLNVQNGILDLRTGTLSPHDPGERITAICSAEFNPVEPAPRWTEFLHELCCGDLQLERYLQLAVGYSLTGMMGEQCFFVMHGTGQNGKSVFLNVLQDVVGEYAVQCAPETFTRSTKGETRTGPREDIVALDGKRFIYGGELEKGTAWAEGMLKRHTGGEKISCRANYGKQFELEPKGKLWFSVNDLPRSASADNGFWRRLRVIPCMNHVDEVDTRLKEKLMAEAAGILLWAVKGCMEWQRHGLPTPAAVERATGNVRGEQDVVTGFIAECCTTGGPEMRVHAGELYQAFMAWCAAEGREGMTQQAFGRSLTAKGFNERRSSRNRYRVGLKLAANSEIVTVSDGLPYSDPIFNATRVKQDNNKKGKGIGTTVTNRHSTLESADPDTCAEVKP